MFTVLEAFLDETLTADFAYDTLFEEGSYQIKKYSNSDISSENFSFDGIHFVILNLDVCPKNSMLFLKSLYEQAYFLPVLLLSSKLDQLFIAFLTVRCCQYALLPLNKEEKLHIEELLLLYYNMYQCMQQRPIVKKNMDAQNYPSSLSDILYIEAMGHKCQIQTKTEKITLSIPLYKVQILYGENQLLQTHRSFLVNPANIKTIFKSKEAWMISFVDSTQYVYVSRKYRKTVAAALKEKIITVENPEENLIL